jgi:hypothetical protein
MPGKASQVSAEFLKDVGPIAAALSAAFSALFVALISFWSTRSNQRDLQKLQSALAEKKSEADARRDYQYEALKRLYAESLLSG